MPRTLLLADDNPTIRRLIALTFEGEDITVIAVDDGDQAIAALDRHAPDIVLAEVGNPGHGGYDVARHIQATPHLAHIPVLLMTGAFEPIDPTAAAAKGCAGVLAKPLEPRRVIGRVRELLARGGPAVAPVAVPTPPLRTAVPEFDTGRNQPLPSAPSPPPAATSTALEVEGYFDRLDQALATRAASPPSPALIAPVDAAEAWTTAAVVPQLPPAVALTPTPDEIVERTARLVLERTARLVLEQLSDQVVRETVGRIVTERADRLIREEIDRIKSNIK